MKQALLLTALALCFTVSVSEPGYADEKKKPSVGLKKSLEDAKKDLDDDQSREQLEVQSQPSTAGSKFKSLPLRQR